MKKVLAFIGSDRKKGTYESVQRFEKALNELTQVEFEYISLNDVNLDMCRGCKLCFDKGEQHCPLKDDRDTIIKKFELADGIVFASPNYAFQVSGRMKNLIDRLAFTFHRPRYFDKACTAIIVQGVYGGSKICRYLESTGRNIGMNVSKGCVVNTLEPMTDQRYQAMDKVTKACANRFAKTLERNAPPKPSIIQLMMFCMTRTGINESPAKFYDYEYFGEMGWYESDYYYDTKIGPFSKMLSRLFDYAGSKIVKMM